MINAAIVLLKTFGIIVSIIILIAAVELYLIRKQFQDNE